MKKHYNLSIRISHEHYIALQKIAEEQERKVADVVRSAFNRYIKEVKND